MQSLEREQPQKLENVMRLAIVGFGLAMLSGAALAEVSAPAIVTPEKSSAY